MQVLFEWGRLQQARFIERENRFRAKVWLLGETVDVHVANTGRMRELLYEGAEVWVRACESAGRKTAYDLVLVKGKNGYVCLMAALANAVFAYWLETGVLAEWADGWRWKREQRYGDSRFDFAYENEEQKGFVEVKSVNLLCEGTAMFPDAPTKRGAKHLRELKRAVEEGYRGSVVFVVMGECERFRLNRVQDPELAAAMEEAVQAGVGVVVYQCRVCIEGIAFGGRVSEVEL